MCASEREGSTPGNRQERLTKHMVNEVHSFHDHVVLQQLLQLEAKAKAEHLTMDMKESLEQAAEETESLGVSASPATYMIDSHKQTRNEIDSVHAQLCLSNSYNRKLRRWANTLPRRRKTRWSKRRMELPPWASLVDAFAARDGRGCVTRCTAAARVMTWPLCSCGGRIEAIPNTTW